MQLLTTGALVLCALLLGTATTSTQSVEKTAPVATKAAPAATKAALNLNLATSDQLEGLPGIGRRTAERILDYRQKNSGFKRIEELMNVKGIGEKSFLKLKPLVMVAPKADKGGGEK